MTVMTKTYFTSTLVLFRMQYLHCLKVGSSDTMCLLPISNTTTLLFNGNPNCTDLYKGLTNQNSLHSFWTTIVWTCDCTIPPGHFPPEPFVLFPMGQFPLMTTNYPSHNVPHQIIWSCSGWELSGSEFAQVGIGNKNMMNTSTWSQPS